MSDIRLLGRRQLAGGAGLSSVEVIVSAALFAIAVTALAGVFNSSLQAIKRVSSRDSTSAVINADLAKIQQLNDYYSCVSGSCAVTSLEASPPDQFQYAPSNADATAFSEFAALCQNSPVNLSQALVEQIGPNSTLASEGSSIVITRTARLHPNNGSSLHLYIVEWTPSQGAITQVTLSPAVSRWCP